MNVALAMLAIGILGLGELPAQQPAPGRCRTFLWLKEEPPLRFAMLDEGARILRVQQEKTTLDLAETGPGVYEGGGYRITLSLRYTTNPNLADGSIVDSGSLRIERSDAAAEAMSFPVGGLRACD